MTKKTNICVVGLGYVGLPTAVNFADKGFNVIGVDKNKEIVDMISVGECHLKDLNIDERLRKVVKNKRLRVSTNIVEATKESDVIIIVVPTPITPDKRPDLTYIMSAAEDIAKGLNKNKLVILESTVYPGVTEEVLCPILEKSGLKAGKDFGVAYCPERYNPGDPNHTIEKVARIVAGINLEWGTKAQKLYQEIVEEVTLVKNIKTAEAAKVIENVQRDLNIALMNELALIFERFGIDIIEVINAAATKWNFNVYYPGAGVGGHCLPVDPYYLVKKAEELGFHPKIITAGRDVNDSMPVHVFELLVDALNDCEKSVKNSKIVILGFSYKENTGDARMSPVEILVEELKKKNANIYIVDPHIEDMFLKKYGKPEKDLYKALENADAVILMTAHDEFREIDLMRVKELMTTPIIIDGRRVFDPEKIKKLGFVYRGIGAGGFNK